MRTSFRFSLLTVYCLIFTQHSILFSCHGAMVDTATGIEFSDHLGKLSLFGVGVRKGGPIKVYSVGLYSTDAAKKSISSMAKDSGDKIGLSSALQTAVKSKLPAVFLIQMNLKVGAEKIANAIAESVAKRHSNPKEVEELKKNILAGIKSKGAATKGTIFRFDCMSDGLDVSVDGKSQGKIKSEAMSKAFCDVYLDENCVSQSMKESCIKTLCKN